MSAKEHLFTFSLYLQTRRITTTTYAPLELICHHSFTISEFVFHTSYEIIFTNSERGICMHFNSDADLYRVIGANIKYYREQSKLTQVQLAEQAKISISYLSKIEASGCSKSLSISVLNQIANVLGVEISAFFDMKV